MLNFCPGTIQNPDYNSCVLPSSATPMSYCSSSTCSTGSQNDTWTDTEIVATVTLPETTPTGGWWVFVTSVAFVAVENFLNPSMGNVEVVQEPAGPVVKLLMNGQDITNATRTISIGKLVDLKVQIVDSAGLTLEATNPYQWTIPGNTAYDWDDTTSALTPAHWDSPSEVEARLDG